MPSLFIGGQIRPAEHCQPGGSPLEHTGQVPRSEVCGDHPGNEVHVFQHSFLLAK